MRGRRPAVGATLRAPVARPVARGGGNIAPRRKESIVKRDGQSFTCILCLHINVVEP